MVVSAVLFSSVVSAVLFSSVVSAVLFSSVVSAVLFSSVVLAVFPPPQATANDEINTNARTERINFLKMTSVEHGYFNTLRRNNRNPV